ncbi:PREDICTED: UPF0496 protein At1g20180-like [Tarenaya hassleriana]|uniref:UPF0496 protein At1g20180-like n=1 Tax=Tarenaya hassleriana TaxID=28532 RepID=UPI00053C170B|nr:PREDICTED: UPF0496 protein At1g20180-like [Tarenaya hassleriana]
MEAEGQLGRTSCDRLSSSPTSSSSSSSSALSFQEQLSDYLLEPRQETIHSLMQESCFHSMLVKFFDSSSEASCICQSILKWLHQIRVNHRKIERVIKICRKACHGESTDRFPEKICTVVFRELSRIASLENPLCVINSEAGFRCLRDSNVDFFSRLMSKRRRIRRNVKFFRFCKKYGGYGLVISNSILAVPPLLGLCSLGMLRKKKKIKRKMNKTDVLEKLGTQLDIAAKGMFILINDFDTLSRLVGRLYDEIEHRKTVAAMCVKSQKPEVLMEAVKEFDSHEQRFSEQLKELEEHVYLCSHTINRSRRLVLEQITGSPQALELCS